MAISPGMYAANIAALHHYPYSLLLYGLGKEMLHDESGCKI